MTETATGIEIEIETDAAMTAIMTGTTTGATGIAIAIVTTVTTIADTTTTTADGTAIAGSFGMATAGDKDRQAATPAEARMTEGANAFRFLLCRLFPVKNGWRRPPL